MIILADTRQQDQKHTQKEKWFADHGIEVRRTKLYVGDYTLPTDQSVCVDTKRDIQELCGNICGKEHQRFRSECQRAQEAGIQLIILVENDREIVYSRNGREIVNYTITDLKDLRGWTNPRLWIFQGGKQKYPSATKGVTLMKSCLTMQSKYGVRFEFCASKDSASRIIDLLTNNNNS